MKSFPKDTKDSIEKLYGREILRFFPRYGEFWSKFIGVKVRRGLLLPYGLRIPSRMSGNDRHRVRAGYEDLSMAHYSLFCHLAGAHFRVQELRALSSPNSSKTSRFRHWEAFESVYLHLGICFNEFSHLWKSFFSMQGSWAPLEAQFGGLGSLPVLRDLENVRRDICARRNNITHYARGANKVIAGKFYVPSRVRGNPTWVEELKTSDWWETRQKAALDLKRTEEAINACHKILITSIETFVVNTGIRVNR